MDKCGICTGAWFKTFLRVNKDSVVQFLKSHHFSKEVPLIARNNNVVDVLWKGERWRIEEIYGKKSVNKTVVSALFLQLTAAKILELVNTKDGIAWKMRCVRCPTNNRDTIRNTKWTLVGPAVTP